MKKRGQWKMPALIAAFSLALALIVGCSQEVSPPDTGWTVSPNDPDNTTAINFVFTESVNLDRDDIIIIPGTGSVSVSREEEPYALSGGGTNWSLAVYNVVPGTVTISIGRSRIASWTRTITVGTTGIMWNAASNSLVNTTGIDITFDRPISDLTYEDIMVSSVTGSATPGELTGSGTTWFLELTDVTAGQVNVRINLAGVANVTRTVDLIVRVIGWDWELDCGEITTQIMFVFDEPVGVLTREDLVIVGTEAVEIGAFRRESDRIFVLEVTASGASRAAEGNTVLNVSFDSPGICSDVMMIPISSPGLVIWSATPNWVPATTAINFDFTTLADGQPEADWQTVIGLTMDDIHLEDSTNGGRGTAIVRPVALTGMYNNQRQLMIQVDRPGTVLVSINRGGNPIAGIAQGPLVVTVDYIDWAVAVHGGSILRFTFPNSTSGGRPYLPWLTYANIEIDNGSGVVRQHTADDLIRNDIGDGSFDDDNRGHSWDLFLNVEHSGVVWVTIRIPGFSSARRFVYVHPIRWNAGFLQDAEIGGTSMPAIEFEFDLGYMAHDLVHRLRLTTDNIRVEGITAIVQVPTIPTLANDVTADSRTWLLPVIVQQEGTVRVWIEAPGISMGGVNEIVLYQTVVVTPITWTVHAHNYYVGGSFNHDGDGSTMELEFRFSSNVPIPRVQPGNTSPNIVPVGAVPATIHWETLRPIAGVPANGAAPRYRTWRVNVSNVDPAGGSIEFRMQGLSGVETTPWTASDRFVDVSPIVWHAQPYGNPTSEIQFTFSVPDARRYLLDGFTIGNVTIYPDGVLDRNAHAPPFLPNPRRHDTQEFTLYVTPNIDFLGTTNVRVSIGGLAGVAATGLQDCEYLTDDGWIVVENTASWSATLASNVLTLTFDRDVRTFIDGATMLQRENIVISTTRADDPTYTFDSNASVFADLPLWFATGALTYSTDGRVWTMPTASSVNSSAGLTSGGLVVMIRGIDVISQHVEGSSSTNHQRLGVVATDVSYVSQGANSAAAILNGMLFTRANASTATNFVRVNSAPDADTPFTAMEGWTSVAAGDAHFAAIRGVGELWTWGPDSSLGRLGRIDPVYPNAHPGRVGAATDWVQVSVGSDFNLGRRGTAAAGSLWAWGNNADGQLGIGSVVGTASTPAQVAGYHADWIYVSAGVSHSMGIRTGGNLFAWGNTADGRTGLVQATPQSFIIGGTTFQIRLPDNSVEWSELTDIYVNVYLPLSEARAPVLVPGGWASVSAGDQHTVAVSTAGHLYAWGSNIMGQLGVVASNSVENGAVVDLLPASDTMMDMNVTYALDDTGTLRPVVVEIGGEYVNSPVVWSTPLTGDVSIHVLRAVRPLRVMPGTGALATGWDSVSAGADHTLAVHSSGIFAWGSNGSGQLGLGTIGSMQPTPLITGAADYGLTRISTGGFSSAGIDGNSDLRVWGQARNVGAPGGGIVIPGAP